MADHGTRTSYDYGCRCDECRKANADYARFARGDKQRKYARERAAERRLLVDAYKLSAGCMDCGHAGPAVSLDLDHRPGEAKIRAVSQMLSSSLSTIEAELEKCDVVCANCHRVRTHSRRRA